MDMLASLLAKSLVTMGSSLLTEKFIIRIVMLFLGYLVKSSNNQLDDQLYNQVQAALTQAGLE